jgi:hypothetical protein
MMGFVLIGFLKNPALHRARSPHALRGLAVRTPAGAHRAMESCTRISGGLRDRLILGLIPSST